MDNHGSFSESEAKIKYYAGRIVSKHKFMLIPCLFVSYILIVACNIVKWIGNNDKRIISFLTVIFCFIGSSSFSFPNNYSDVALISSSEVNSAVDNYGSSLLKESSVNSTSNISESSAAADTDKTVKSGEDEAQSGSQTESTVQTDSSYSEEDTVAGLTEIQNASAALESTDDAALCTPIVTAENAADNATGFSHDAWNLILINRLHPIPDNYSFPLSRISGNMYCDQRVLTSIKDMFEAADNDGIDLVICSPYRSDNHQEYLFNKKINNYLDEGVSYMDAYCKTAQAVTIPGTSEHQVGLALDIVSKGYRSLDAGFGETKEGKWLASNAPKYGFILRYPEDKYESTGIEYEPWHFRYVGTEAAKKITKENITLEEFWEQYVK